jgi:conjugative transfer region protein TrbK
MRGRLLNMAAIGRAVGFVAVAIALLATMIHFAHEGRQERGRAPSAVSSTATDALASELAHCRTIGMAATDDLACEAAWAENRHRFFSYGPSATSQAARAAARQQATPKAEGK